MSTPKKKVLVCGASGFVGRNIFEALSRREDLEVYGTYFTRNFSDNPRLFKVNLRALGEAMKVTSLGFDVVIQSAAVTSGAKDIVSCPQIHVADNNVMNTWLLDAASTNSVKHFIFLSSSVVYPMDLERPAKESDFDPERIHEKYFGGAWMKICGEKFCEFYSRLGRTKLTVIRPANLYGPYDKFDLERSHVTGATITKVVSAPYGGTIDVWGDGSEERDLLHVSDLVRFVELVLERQEEPFGIWNVGSGQLISVRELTELVMRLWGKELTVKFDPTKPTIQGSKLALDSSKARRDFGWSLQVSLEEGLRRTIQWYRENIVQHDLE